MIIEEWGSSDDARVWQLTLDRAFMLGYEYDPDARVSSLWFGPFCLLWWKP